MWDSRPSHFVIIPNTKRHPNDTKTDLRPISEVITGLPRPYHNKLRLICQTHVSSSHTNHNRPPPSAAEIGRNQYCGRPHARGATQSSTTRVSGGFTCMRTTRHRVRTRPKTRRVFRAGYPRTLVPVQHRVPEVTMCV